MADYLSRAKVGDNFVHPNNLEIEALEQVSLSTLSPKALADSQAICPEVKSHKMGNMPKSVKMGVETVDGVELYCEVSGNPRPMVPLELREVIMQTFHALGHPQKKETGRRISDFYYWPKMKQSTRNPDPVYIDSLELKCSCPPPFKGFPINRTWSASADDLEAINKSIRGI